MQDTGVLISVGIFKTICAIDPFFQGSWQEAIKNRFKNLRKTKRGPTAKSSEIPSKKFKQQVLKKGWTNMCRKCLMVRQLRRV